jgi:hypothetical protein
VTRSGGAAAEGWLKTEGNPFGSGLVGCIGTSISVLCMVIDVTMVVCRHGGLG